MKNPLNPIDRRMMELKIKRWWKTSVTKQWKPRPKDPALSLRPKKGGYMSVCTGANSKNGGTITVGLIPGGVVIEIDNGHKFVRKIAVATADIPAVAEALRSGKPIQRQFSSSSNEKFIIKRTTGLSAAKEPSDDPREKLDAMMRQQTDRDQREAMRSGRATSYTPHCCTDAGRAWLHEQPYHSTLIIYANNTAAWLHDATGKPAELASLMERVGVGTL